MLLAIDTSTEWIGIALFNGTNVLAEQTWRSKNYHTVELIPAIKEMLTKTQTKASSLTGMGRICQWLAFPRSRSSPLLNPACADRCLRSWKSVAGAMPTCVTNTNKAPGKLFLTSQSTICVRWQPPSNRQPTW